MQTIFETRQHDSPYIAGIWRVSIGSNYAPICPADPRWNLLFMRYEGRVTVSVEGPLTYNSPRTQPEGIEGLVIKFKLGTYLRVMPVTDMLDKQTELPGASSKSFWLNGSAWELPSFENIETFVARLARDGVLVHDQVVGAALQAQPQALSDRTIRRRFLHATGLTHGKIAQIERAQRAMTLLQNGTSILDAAYEAGYADQPHLTRSLRHYVGFTPAQIAAGASG